MASLVITLFSDLLSCRRNNSGPDSFVRWGERGQEEDKQGKIRNAAPTSPARSKFFKDSSVVGRPRATSLLEEKHH